MDRKKIYLFLISVLVAACGEAYAGKALSNAAESFRKDYPSVRFDKIEKTEIDGVYEVAAGGNVFYYHQKTGNILFGEMITKNFKNVTAERRNSLIASFLKSLPLDKAIRIGQGKDTVIEIVDIDCHFCRKVEDFFEKQKDVSRYVFLFPLEKLHPQSLRKSIAVLCSRNQADAYQKAMKGHYDGSDANACSNQDAARLLDEHKEIAKRLGVQGILRSGSTEFPLQERTFPRSSSY